MAQSDDPPGMVHLEKRSYDFEQEDEYQGNEKMLGVPTVTIDAGYEVKGHEYDQAVDKPTKPDQRGTELLYGADV